MTHPITSSGFTLQGQCRNTFGSRLVGLGRLVLLLRE
jgi:hypothetical protein